MTDGDTWAVTSRYPVQQPTARDEQKQQEPAKDQDDVANWIRLAVFLAHGNGDAEECTLNIVESPLRA